jgi:hypothetical protein
LPIRIKEASTKGVKALRMLLLDKLVITQESANSLASVIPLGFKKEQSQPFKNITVAGKTVNLISTLASS